jgi:hypothetical protein
MALARWQRTIVDNAGNILPGAQITVRREVSGAPLAVLYSDRDGTVPLGNPFTADPTTAFAAFHAAGGAHRIDVVSGAFSQTLRYVGIGTMSEKDTAALLLEDFLDFPEIAEPDTPPAGVQRGFASNVDGGSRLAVKNSNGDVLELLRIGNVKNYGAKGDGSTDDTLAITTAITAVGVGGDVEFPAGVFIFSDHDADGIGLIQLSGQKWSGAGRGATVLRLAAATTDIDVLIYASDFAEDYAIEDMQIDGNRANITPAVDLYNHFYMIVGPRGGKRGVYRNLHLANSWGRVFQSSHESVSEYAEDILVEGVWVTNAGTKAISATQSKRVTIRGCFAEVDPYTSADHPGGVGDGNAESGSCFECNDANTVVICGNHGVQIGAVVKAPGIRFVNSCHSIRAFGNTIEGAQYLGFIQNADDVDFFGNLGRDLAGNAILIADADGEAGTCRRVRVHHNTVIDPDGAYVLITANNSGHDPEVECYIYENDFVQISGTPTHGIYNNGVVSPATVGVCEVYQWGNNFRGTIPNQLAGPAAAQIREHPERGWQILSQSSVAVSVTGTTTETNLVTITVPANRMGANGRLRITAHWSYTNSANNKIQRIRFAGTQLFASTQTTTTQQKVISEIGNRNSLSSQVTGVGGTVDGLGAGTALVTTTHDTASNQNITLTGQLANAGETITLESYVVELFYAV